MHVFLHIYTHLYYIVYIYVYIHIYTINYLNFYDNVLKSRFNNNVNEKHISLLYQLSIYNKPIL